MTPALRWGRWDGLRYGLPGFALAFIALPLYVVLPHHYAEHFGMPLATLGGLLLATRLADALVDPMIGRVVDRLFARSAALVLRYAAATSLVLAAGVVALFAPPTREASALLAWAACALVVTYLAWSALSVAHQSWGAMLGGDEAQRGRIVAWREGQGVVGVLLASVLPSVLGLPWTAGVFAAALACGLWAWWNAPRPQAALRAVLPSAPATPWQRPAFRRLMAVFMLNGIASAVPATLVLFFVQDRLLASASLQPWFLACYFACAALSLPLWLAMVARWGLARTWLAAMVLAIAAFGWSAVLGAGDVRAFLVICALSGAALGADLALPGAILAGVIAESGDRGAREGSYFGWWNFASKLNLALAAGLALPLLGWAGYAPGNRAPQALQALTAAYCLLPCALKALAAASLYFGFVRPRDPR